MSSRTMEVDYEITRDDLFAFQWRAVFTSPKAVRRTRWTYAFWLVPIVLFAAVPAIGPDGFVLSRISLTFIAIAFAICVLSQRILERWLMRRVIRRQVADERPQRGQLGRHTLSLSEDGLIERTAVGESRTAWTGVDRVEQDRAYIFIYTSAAAAHVIPKRAFRSAEEAERFYQLSRASKEAAG